MADFKIPAMEAPPGREEMVEHSVRVKFVACVALGLCFLLSAKEAWGWGPGGHMIVARIAYDRLNPRAKGEVDRLIALTIEPTAVTKRSLDFVNAAHWPDDLRSIPAFKDTLPLHFVDIPFSADGTDLPSDLPEQQNVVTALKKYVAILKSDSADQQRAQALRFIIHFVGDIHQPLHCATRVTKGMPEGDHGGNSFSLVFPGRDGEVHKINLHSFWDGGIDNFPKGGPNFAPPSLGQIAPAAAGITAEFPDTDDGWKAGGSEGFEVWAQESTELAETVAYNKIKPNSRPSQSYKQAALGTVQRRVAWAGYRLAELLNSIWPEQ